MEGFSQPVTDTRCRATVRLRGRRSTVQCEWKWSSDSILNCVWHYPGRAKSAGWLTFGFGRSLDEAAAIATVEMVKLMGELYGFSPRQALSLAVVDLRITQMVNGIRGVHALLRDDSIEQRKEPKA